MNDEDEARRLAESILEADREIREIFRRHPQFDPRDMDAMRRHTYVTTIRLWMQNLSPKSNRT